MPGLNGRTSTNGKRILVVELALLALGIAPPPPPPTSLSVRSDLCARTPDSSPEGIAFLATPAAADVLCTSLSLLALLALGIAAPAPPTVAPEGIAFLAAPAAADML